MNLSSTITGLPYVGKTTLFNLLTGAQAETGAFAGAEGETNVGVTKVPDERIDRLAALEHRSEGWRQIGHGAVPGSRRDSIAASTFSGVAGGSIRGHRW